MMNLSIDHYELPAADKLEREDKWVLSKLNRLVKEVTENLDKLRDRRGLRQGL